MASKLVRHCHLRALSSSISNNNHIRSPHFSNPNQAPLSFNYRLFSNAASSSSTGGFQRASSLKDLKLANFASIVETWWDSEGPFKPLHVMNPTGLAFIRTRPVAIPTQNSFLVVCFGRYQASNMASKLVRHSHLRALISSISINNHIRSPHFSILNPNRASLSYRLFYNASSSSSTRGFQRASSLKGLELAKFASIVET